MKQLELYRWHNYNSYINEYEYKLYDGERSVFLDTREERYVDGNDLDKGTVNSEHWILVDTLTYADLIIRFPYLLISE